jgi:hypothetical protein
MGKGGEAIATRSKGLQLSDKAQKYTWAEVKKHVSSTDLFYRFHSRLHF